VIERLSDAVAKVIATPDVRARLTDLGLTVEHMSPQQLASRERAYARAWAQIIGASGFKAQ